MSHRFNFIMLLISTLLFMLLSESWNLTAGTAPIKQSELNTIAYQATQFNISYNRVCKFPCLTSTGYSFPCEDERTILIDGSGKYLVQTFAKAYLGLWMITWKCK